MAAPRHAFRFTNTQLCFAFTATLGNRGTRTPIERLPDTESVRQWLIASGLSADSITVSAGDFAHAVELREAIYRAGHRLADGDEPLPSDVDVLNAQASAPSARPHWDGKSPKLTWATTSVQEALSRVATDALQTLSAMDTRRRIRVCDNPKCGGLFLDASRAGSRRWCSMRTCGASAKKRAYRSRIKAGAVA